MSADLTAEASFTRIEEDVRRFWRRHGVPEAFYTARRDGSPYLLCHQPLVAAGGSPTDHVRLLATADLFARAHAMRGSAVHRQTGWVCHGLPIELAVERSLGRDMAESDLARFNAACRQAAIEGVQQGQALAERLGVWPDQGHTFLSLEPQAVGLVWGALRRLWEAGRLRHVRRIASVCPRCATPLSSTEASRRTVEVQARSLWVQLPWEGEPGAYLLIWMPQPWMLAGLVALAAHPEAEYALVEWPAGDEPPPDRGDLQPTRLLLAEAALKQALPGGYQLVRRLSGRALRAARYHPPFTFLPAGEATGSVLLSKAVPLNRGTGLWPVTPTFDALSLALAQDRGLLVPKLLNDWGRWDDAVMPWRGLSPLDTEALLVEDLRARGLLFEEQAKGQPQSLCPYCETPLLPLAYTVWQVETDDGPWLVSRDRPWGVPLPVWVCQECGEELCVAGLDDLARRAGLDAAQLDLHRPAVDHWMWACERCGGRMRRVAPVVDAAFEAAVLSGSAVSKPGLAIGLGDRTRGWLGDLDTVVALLPGALAWEQAIALPEHGRRAAWDLERAGSADALRWAAYTDTTPDQAEREFLRPLWRLATLPLAVGQAPSSRTHREEGREDPTSDLLDRWLRARFHVAVSAVTQALEAHEPDRAAGELACLVSDLTDWYAPCQSGGGGEILEALTRLLAPFVPHLAEAIHRQTHGGSVESIHLAAWPSPEPAWEDRVLLVRVAHLQRLVALGQSARIQAGVAPDGLLRRAVLGFRTGDPREWAEFVPFEGLLAGMLGVRQVQFAPDAVSQVRWRLALDPEQSVERDVDPAEITFALENLDAGEAMRLVSELWGGLSIGLQVSGRAITLLPDEVCISAQARPGWSAAADARHLVILEVG